MTQKTRETLVQAMIFFDWLDGCYTEYKLAEDLCRKSTHTNADVLLAEALIEKCYELGMTYIPD